MRSAVPETVTSLISAAVTAEIKGMDLPRIGANVTDDATEAAAQNTFPCVIVYDHDDKEVPVSFTSDTKVTGREYPLRVFIADRAPLREDNQRWFRYVRDKIVEKFTVRNRTRATTGTYVGSFLLSAPCDGIRIEFGDRIAQDEQYQMLGSWIRLYFLVNAVRTTLA